MIPHGITGLEMVNIGPNKDVRMFDKHFASVGKYE
jgi:hypothetical protein